MNAHGRLAAAFAALAAMASGAAARGEDGALGEESRGTVEITVRIMPAFALVPDRVAPLRLVAINAPDLRFTTRVERVPADDGSTPGRGTARQPRENAASGDLLLIVVPD